jgi:hypothetical protein
MGVVSKAFTMVFPGAKKAKDDTAGGSGDIDF